MPKGWNCDHMCIKYGPFSFISCYTPHIGQLVWNIIIIRLLNCEKICKRLMQKTWKSWFGGKRGATFRQVKFEILFSNPKDIVFISKAIWTQNSYQCINITPRNGNIEEVKQKLPVGCMLANQQPQMRSIENWSSRRKAWCRLQEMDGEGQLGS